MCVVSAHPIVLKELRKILNPAASRSDGRRLAVCNSEHLQFPKSSVYLIDSASCSMGAAEQVRQILQQQPDANILVLGESFQQQYAFELLSLGVKGMVTHDKMAEHLPKAIQTISQGGLWVWRDMLSDFVDALVCRSRRKEDVVLSQDVRMSGRERQIADALRHNLTNKEIANLLHISERTVKFHVSNLLSKFKVQRRSDLLLLWYEKSGSATETALSS